MNKAAPESSSLNSVGRDPVSWSDRRAVNRTALVPGGGVHMPEGSAEVIRSGLGDGSVSRKTCNVDLSHPSLSRHLFPSQTWPTAVCPPATCGIESGQVVVWCGVYVMWAPGCPQWPAGLDYLPTKHSQTVRHTACPEWGGGQQRPSSAVSSN
ncbi:hypothetical protein RRG08_034984 [Elysia crispata]|uniref:Uncharacterized protein n=1 Tax=Elysia crispata TaxID=231223 RepID=A0AAE0Y239_9GAST|nr:hypothetical protein RRG08_034984 [Elysia crispata]